VRTTAPVVWGIAGDKTVPEVGRVLIGNSGVGTETTYIKPGVGTAIVGHKTAAAHNG
jgi:hypothetical protein